MAKTGQAKANLKSQIATSSDVPSLGEIVPPQVQSLRGVPIVLDQDLAPRLGVTTARLNEAVKRNIERFPPDWLFQLSTEEVAALGPSVSHGGRRKPPWAFTEHGVVMAASVLKSATAIQAMQYVVSVFVETRKSAKSELALPSPANNSPLAVTSGNDNALSAKIKGAIERVLESVIDTKNQTTVREEAENVMTEALHSLKERLKKAGAENEELAARATALLAEAEAHKAAAKKTRAETERIELATLARKLRLVLEVELAMQSGDIKNFIGVLDRMSDH